MGTTTGRLSTHTARSGTLAMTNKGSNRTFVPAERTKDAHQLPAIVAGEGFRMIKASQKPVYCRCCRTITLEPGGFCMTCRAWIDVGRALAAATDALRRLPDRRKLSKAYK